jgi:hypothetical protein
VHIAQSQHKEKEMNSKMIERDISTLVKSEHDDFDLIVELTDEEMQFVAGAKARAVIM